MDKIALQAWRSVISQDESSYTDWDVTKEDSEGTTSFVCLLQSWFHYKETMTGKGEEKQRSDTKSKIS